MTDDNDLVKRLRKRQEFEFIDGYKRIEWEDDDALEAADRIEALTEARDTMGRLWAKEAAEKQVALGRIDELEAKLVKAMEALRRIANSQPRPMRSGGYEGHDVSNMQRTARATLAEIDGDKT